MARKSHSNEVIYHLSNIQNVALVNKVQKRVTLRLLLKNMSMTWKVHFCLHFGPDECLMYLIDIIIKGFCIQPL